MQSCSVLTHALVYSPAEGEMSRRFPVQIEFVRVLPPAWIPVCCRVAHHDAAIGWNDSAANVDLGCCLSEHCLHRGRPPQRLVKGDTCQSWICLQFLPLIRVACHAIEQAGNPVNGCIHARGDQRTCQQWGMVGQDIPAIRGSPDIGTKSFGFQCITLTFLHHPLGPNPLLPLGGFGLCDRPDPGG